MKFIAFMQHMQKSEYTFFWLLTHVNFDKLTLKLYILG